MRFVHIADMHFDSPFVNLSDRAYMGDLRRLEQRKVFKKIIDYIKDNKIEYLFIAGDLYEQKYIKQSTIEYINNLFNEIPETKIFITPGNHDPIIKNSYYNKFKFSENVKIFDGKFEKIEFDDVDIYGYGFDDFYCIDSGMDVLQIDNKEKINILIMHATLNGASIEEKQYNSINQKKLEEKGFDYIALGHIHKSNYGNLNAEKIIYPGSTVSLGFDELGKHGMIVGNIENKLINLEFISLDESEFKEIEIDVTEILSRDELIEKINELKIEKNNLIKINLIGKRNFEINTQELYKLNLNEKIIKIKNNTKINYNLEKLQNENTLIGLFVKECLKQLNEEEDINKKQIIEKAIEIGIDVLT